MADLSAGSSDDVAADPDLSSVWDARRAEAAGLVRMSRRPGFVEYLHDLWERRQFIVLGPIGDLRQQHMNTVFGSAWHLLSPLLMSGVYYLVFGVLLGARASVDNYAVYLIAGLLTFRFSQKCIQSGAKTVVKNERLLQNIQFPAAVLPISTVLTETLAHVPALLVLFAFALATGEPVLLGWLLVVPVTIAQSVMNLGFAFITARATVHFRDIEEILQYILRLAFYLSGVIIGVDAIPEDEATLRTLFMLNPFYAYIRLVRSALFTGTLEIDAVLISAGWTIGLLLAGYAFFWQNEGNYGNVN